MLLDHLGETGDATRLREAVRAVVAAGDHVTADLGGDASTETMTAAIIDRL